MGQDATTEIDTSLVVVVSSGYDCCHSSSSHRANVNDAAAAAVMADVVLKFHTSAGDNFVCVLTRSSYDGCEYGGAIEDHDFEVVACV